VGEVSIGLLQAFFVKGEKAKYKREREAKRSRETRDLLNIRPIPRFKSRIIGRDTFGIWLKSINEIMRLSRNEIYYWLSL
jgi:hypothetical protein